MVGQESSAPWKVPRYIRETDQRHRASVGKRLWREGPLAKPSLNIAHSYAVSHSTIARLDAGANLTFSTFQ
jgi:hypothetical protein